MSIITISILKSAFLTMQMQKTQQFSKFYIKDSKSKFPASDVKKSTFVDLKLTSVS